MEPVAHDTWLIIADGSAEIAEGQRKLAELQQRALPMRVARGYPKLVDSATLPGLKPGFHVVVLGACADRAMADVRLQLARAVAPGAYLRKVSAEDACPAVDRSAAPVAGGPELGAWPVGAGAGAFYTFRRPASGACAEATGVVELRLEDQTVVSTLVLPGVCAPGTGTRWDAPASVLLDGSTLLAFRSRQEAETGELVHDSLYGFVCGQWRALIGPLAGGARFEGAGPGRLRASGPAGVDTTYTLDPATCEMSSEVAITDL